LGEEVGNVEVAEAFGIPRRPDEVGGAAGLAGIAPREIEEAVKGGACGIVHSDSFLGTLAAYCISFPC
jgi:hypothetical protein